MVHSLACYKVKTVSEVFGLFSVCKMSLSSNVIITNSSLGFIFILRMDISFSFSVICLSFVELNLLNSYLEVGCSFTNFNSWLA